MGAQEITKGSREVVDGVSPNWEATATLMGWQQLIEPRGVTWYLYATDIRSAVEKLRLDEYSYGWAFGKPALFSGSAQRAVWISRQLAKMEAKNVTTR